MPTPTPFPRIIGAMLASLLFAASLGAKMEQWTDVQGQTFKAEPAEAIGPLALFRLPNKSGKLVPFGRLSEADCARFALQVRGLARPAADWSQTKTDLGGDIYGSAMRVVGDRLKDVDLKGQPEPRFFVLFFASNAESNSWGMLGRTNWPLQELQRTHPGLVEGFMYGLKHSGSDHAKMAVHMKVPYLVSYFDGQSRMSAVARLVPSWGYGLVAANANGVPLFLAKGDTDESAKALFADLTGVLELLRPDNPQGWRDSLHYLRAAQPALHAEDTCGPLLVGDPLNARKLAELGVRRFEAKLSVDDAGAVGAVEMAPGTECPAELVAPITEALRQAQLVPAVDHGRFVAGTYDYHFGPGL